MKSLTFKQLSQARREQSFEDVPPPRGKRAFPDLPHRSDALVKQFARFSSFAFCAPALPHSLFYVKQKHKK
jgi:hypothetical protein